MENLNRTNVLLTSLLNTGEILEIAMSTEVTVQQAKDYIDDHNNPEKYRDKIADLLRRYDSAIKKNPGRMTMFVDRIGLCSLWID